MKPKPFRQSTRFSRLFLASFLLVAANAAHAQTTFFWDADGDASFDTGGSGIWNTTSLSWRDGGSFGLLSPWLNTEPAVDTAQFEGTAGTVTLNSDSENINFNQIIFVTTGYVIEEPLAGTATLNLSGDAPTISVANDCDATIWAAISGVRDLRKSGAGTLTLSGSNTYTGTTRIATTSTNGGIVNITGDHSAADGGWNIHGLSTVNFLSGSTIAVAAGRNITLANSASAGAHTLNVAGTVNSNGGLVVRGRSNLNINSGAEWTQNAGLTIQPQNTTYTATMNVRSGASFSYNGSPNIILARSATGNNGSATLNIAGGTFTTSRGFSNSNARTSAGGASNLNFTNGGTLALSEEIPTLILEEDANGAPFNVSFGNGGGVIDTNGFDTMIEVEVKGIGSLTKTGEGTLTLLGAINYEGDTIVTGGTLSLAEDNFSNDFAAVRILESGMLELNFFGTDHVDKLFIGGTRQPAGVYGHSSTGATNGGQGVGALDARFAEGSGTLTVISDPVGTPFEIFMAGYPGLVGDDALPEADPDGDGLSNVAEFIMGGTAPDSGSAANRPVEAVIDGHLTMSILVPTGATFAGSPSPSAIVQGVEVAVGGSLDLATFARPVEETVANPGLPSAPDGYRWHTFRLSQPISSQARGFLRASFSKP